MKHFMCITRAKPGLWSLLGGKGTGQRTSRDKGTEGDLGLDLVQCDGNMLELGSGVSSGLKQEEG